MVDLIDQSFFSFSLFLSLLFFSTLITGDPRAGKDIHDVTGFISQFTSQSTSVVVGTARDGMRRHEMRCHSRKPDQEPTTAVSIRLKRHGRDHDDNAATTTVRPQPRPHAVAFPMAFIPRVIPAERGHVAYLPARVERE